MTETKRCLASTCMIGYPFDSQTANAIQPPLLIAYIATATSQEVRRYLALPPVFEKSLLSPSPCCYITESAELRRAWQSRYAYRTTDRKLICAWQCAVVKLTDDAIGTDAELIIADVHRQKTLRLTKVRRPQHAQQATTSVCSSIIPHLRLTVNIWCYTIAFISFCIEALECMPSNTVRIHIYAPPSLKNGAGGILSSGVSFSKSERVSACVNESLRPKNIVNTIS